VRSREWAVACLDNAGLDDNEDAFRADPLVVQVATFVVSCQSDLMAQADQFALGAPASPARILCCEFGDRLS